MTNVRDTYFHMGKVTMLQDRTNASHEVADLLVRHDDGIATGTRPRSVSNRYSRLAQIMHPCGLIKSHDVIGELEADDILPSKARCTAVRSSRSVNGSSGYPTERPGRTPTLIGLQP